MRNSECGIDTVQTDVRCMVRSYISKRERCQRQRLPLFALSVFVFRCGHFEDLALLGHGVFFSPYGAEERLSVR